VLRLLGAASYCDAVAEDVAVAQTWGKLAVLLVTAINQVLKRSIKSTARLLKAHTLEEEMGSKAIRVYFCQLANTAVLILLLTSDFGPFSIIPGTHYATINSEWYASIGAPMVSTMLIQFFTAWGIDTCTYTMKAPINWLKGRLAPTQNARNATQAPPEFDLSAKYGEILLAISVILVFSSGIPLLYWVGAFGFTVRFWVDKWMVLRVCAKPPLYSSQLIEDFDTILVRNAAHAREYD
jgi:hypothetical protein